LAAYKKYDYFHKRILLVLQTLVFCAVLSVAPFLIENITGKSLLASIVANHDSTVSISGPGTYVHFHSLSPNLHSFATHFPLALWSGMFAPLPWQTHHWLAFGASIENATLVLLLIVCVIKSIAPAMRPNPKRQEGLAFPEDTILTRLLLTRLLAQTAWLYILLLATVLAFASPNFGALTRYKVGFLPFFAYILMSGALGKQPQRTGKNA